MIASSPASSPPLLEVRDLSVRYPVRRGLFGGARGEVRAVESVSFELGEGETLGLVGESGSGKTTLGRAVLRLVEADGGTIRFEGRDVRALRGEELRALRCRMQPVFQDPWASLNPRMTVGAIVGEGLRVHRLARGDELDRRVAALLEQVGLPAAAAMRRPAEFSGGQRQRIGIARALAVAPSLVVCDEAVAALDVSVQAQILNLLVELRERHRLAYLFISHDLAVVRHVSRRVAVMYLGRLVEVGPTESVLTAPRHPYTAALLAATPRGVAGPGGPRRVLAGEPPPPSSPPSGCAFAPRCPQVRDECRSAPPPLRAVAPGHTVRCIL